MKKFLRDIIQEDGFPLCVVIVIWLLVMGFYQIPKWKEGALISASDGRIVKSGASYDSLVMSAAPNWP